MWNCYCHMPPERWRAPRRRGRAPRPASESRADCVERATSEIAQILRCSCRIPPSPVQAERLKGLTMINRCITYNTCNTLRFSFATNDETDSVCLYYVTL